MTDRLAARIDARLRSLREAGLLRTLRPPAGIDLSSNDYLGLARDPRVVARVRSTAVAREGAGSTGSRLLRGRPRRLRRRGAAPSRCSRAPSVRCTSRAATSRISAVLTTLPEAGDVVLSDERNHASLIDAMRLSSATRVDRSAQRSGRARGRAAHRAIERPAADGQVFVVVESALQHGRRRRAARRVGRALPRRSTRRSSSTRRTRCGRLRREGQRADRGGRPRSDACISINTAGKALGVGGAFVAGPAWAIDYLIQRARPFVFSTAPPPAVAAAIDGEPSTSSRPSRSGERASIALARLARERLAAAGIDVRAGDSPIVPIVIGDNAPRRRRGGAPAGARIRHPRDSAADRSGRHAPDCVCRSTRGSRTRRSSSSSRRSPQCSKK